MRDIEGSSNLGSASAEYPSSSNGQVFSINREFKFQVDFTVDEADVKQGDWIGLIQVIAQSERILRNSQYTQRSFFPPQSFPVLDGDVQETGILWYRTESSIPIDSVGRKKLILPDNPQTAPSEDPQSNLVFRGNPSALEVKETFIIILAKLSQGSYEKLAAWSWSYSDKNEKKDNKWNAGIFKATSEDVSVDAVNLTQLKGDVRANNTNITEIELVSKAA